MKVSTVLNDIQDLEQKAKENIQTVQMVGGLDLTGRDNATVHAVITSLIGHFSKDEEDQTDDPYKQLACLCYSHSV